MAKFNEIQDILSQSESRFVRFRTIAKGAAIIAVAPVMLLLIFVVQKQIDIPTALGGLGFIMIISFIFVYPYMKNLSSLTQYVQKLSRDEYAEAPDLSFLNNVEELSTAVEDLHKSWDKRRSQLEAMLTESKLLIDTLPDILIMLNKKRDILRSNQAARNFFGIKESKKKLQQIIKTDEVQNLIRTVNREEKGASIPFFLKAPYNRYYIIRVEPFPIFSPGNIAYILAMHDITEQKHVEQTLSDFVANASHEIRTPLTSIMGLIETLQTSAKGDDNASETFLKIMEVQTQRITQLVKDLLSLSQIERNISKPPQDLVNTRPLLRRSIENAQMVAKEKNLQIKSKISNGSMEMIGDELELLLIFDNIISNAIKYSKKGSEVKIEVTIEKKSKPNWLRFSVTDEGVGIEKKHLKRLTERFYRVDDARSREVGGTGLGLAIVKRALERHNGNLEIESTIGEGSTFRVILPLAEL